MNNELKKIEAALFSLGSAVSKKKLSGLLGCTGEQLGHLLDELREIREESGVVLIDDGSKVMLTVNPKINDFMENVKREEEKSPLSKAAQETLSIIAYAGPISKVDLDFLRGVNTQYTLRKLAMRGLIRDNRERSGRTVSITTDFLAHLGVQKVEALSEYTSIRESILTGLQSIKKKAGEKEI